MLAKKTIPFAEFLGWFCFPVSRPHNASLFRTQPASSYLGKPKLFWFQATPSAQSGPMPYEKVVRLARSDVVSISGLAKNCSTVDGIPTCTNESAILK
jgi:hypothetical protein